MAGRSRGGRVAVSKDPAPAAPAKAKKKGSGSGGGQESDDDPCDFSFTTPLNGPVAAVVKSLKDGDKLRVEVRTGSPFPSVVCVVPATGKVAGSLATATEIPDLIDCHASGHRYEARVMGAKQPPVVRVYRITKP